MTNILNSNCILIAYNYMARSKYIKLETINGILRVNTPQTINNTEGTIDKYIDFRTELSFLNTIHPRT